MKLTTDTVAIGIGTLGAGKATLMVAGGDPFTPSWLQSMGVMCGVIIIMAGVIIRNQMKIKEAMQREPPDAHKRGEDEGDGQLRPPKSWVIGG